MNDVKKEWEEKIRSQFSSSESLMSFISTTMENFYYRYMETETHKDLKSEVFGPKLIGAVSLEESMVQALKMSHPDIKKNIMELARRVPKAQKPCVQYGLFSEIHELTTNHGKLRIFSTVNWDYPEFKEKKDTQMIKEVWLKYEDLQEFRKDFPLCLETVCELFL